ncbi:glycosyltransferase [Inmirania thermothiophila]|nr:glycosyltransferase [Inmirania thermothiophila]
MRPRVSVVMPVRDGGAALAAAVESILAQTLGELELIVVDDGSRDGAPGRLPRDARLRVVPAAGRGIVAALNTGIALARAPLVARMDADDLAHPERLARQLAWLEACPEAGICGAQVEIVTDAGPPGGGFRRYRDWLNGLRSPAAIAREIFVESPIPHPTAVIRRAVLERLGGYREVPWPEDYDLWLRAWAAGVPMGKPEGVLLAWRDRPGRLSRCDPRCSPAAFRAARAHFLARTVLAAGRCVIWGAGPTGARLADALAAEGVAVAAFVDIDPRKIGRTRRGRPIRPVSALARANLPVVVAVGAAGARETIRAALPGLGRREGRDLWFAA